MKDLSLIVWLSQLGLSVAAPLGCSTLLAVWLRNRFDWGNWIIWVGLGLGLICAISGLRSSLKAMSRLAKPKSEDPPPVSFNNHD